MFDLVIGEWIGNINFFKNIGMVGEFLFDVDLEVVLNIFVLGNINMAIFGSILGYFVL